MTVLTTQSRPAGSWRRLPGNIDEAELNRYDVHGCTDIGRVRETNEDYFLVLSGRKLFVVADGLGGHQAGEVASCMAAHNVANALGQLSFHPTASDTNKIEETLVRTLHDVHADVRKAGDSEPTQSGMGCTIVVALIDNGILHMANVGDARAYVSNEAGIVQLSVDHRKLEESTSDGNSATQLSVSRSALAQAIGTSRPIVPAYSRQLLQPGDRVLLCSDGLTDRLSNPEIQRVLGSNLTASAMCEQLIDMANTHGGQDNITTVVVVVS